MCVAGCGGSGHGADHASTRQISADAGTLDAIKLEQAITASARAQRGAKATVDCPSGIPLKAKTRFYCVAEVGRRDTPFLVTERNAEGSVAYAGVQPSQAPLLNSVAVETAIKRTVANAGQTGARVRCPTGIPQQRGLQFVCLATTKGTGTTQFLVSETDSDGHVRYRTR